jgi:hypothetical protein
MRLAKPIFLLVLAVFLSAYAFDCGAMTTRDQAMHCCKTMPCSSRGHHGQDCCKTMPAAHAPFVQRSVAYGVSSSPVVVAAISTVDASFAINSSVRSAAEISHAPPVVYSSAPLPLRI